MRFKRFLLPLAASLALLTACGGGDPDVPGSGSPSGAPTTKGTFTTVVSFGDSLSDAGTYSQATSLAGNGTPPFFGGKFTTNGPGATVWVENLAATLGVPISVAEMGFGPIPSTKCPAATTTCTAYGQGGSRVTDPNGIGKAGGALTVPVVTQIANHLQRFGSFKASDLILVYAGSNDVFTQFGGFVAAATQIQTQAATGAITADEANRRLFAAQTAAQAGMKQAAQELAGYVKNQILAKGGKYVAVMLLSDIAETPFGSTLPSPAVRQVLSDLSSIFNLWLRDGLTDQPVQLIDTWTLFKQLKANATALGFADSSNVACSAAKIEAFTHNTSIQGSSLFCNATPNAPYNGLADGASASTWFFADSVHPTTGGHKAISDAFTAALRGFGWI